MHLSINFHSKLLFSNGLYGNFQKSMIQRNCRNNHRYFDYLLCHPPSPPPPPPPKKPAETEATQTSTHTKTCNRKKHLVLTVFTYFWENFQFHFYLKWLAMIGLTRFWSRIQNLYQQIWLGEPKFLYLSVDIQKKIRRTNTKFWFLRCYLHCWCR